MNPAGQHLTRDNHLMTTNLMTEVCVLTVTALLAVCACTNIVWLSLCPLCSVRELCKILRGPATLRVKVMQWDQ